MIRLSGEQGKHRSKTFFVRVQPVAFNLIYFASNSVSEIQTQLTADLINVIGWLDTNFLILNLDQTKIMLVGTHHKLAEAENLVIDVNNTRLEMVNNFKYLGVLLDRTLSWKDHVEYIGNKISSEIGMLRRARKVLPKATCLMLYNTIVCRCLTIARLFGTAVVLVASFIWTS